jgi:hypothetical protein
MSRIKVSRVFEVPSVTDMEDEPLRWVVEGFLARSTVTMVTSISGSGKTFLSTALCGAVAAGELFAGMKTIQQPVLYLDRENPRWIVQSRLRAMKIRDGEEGDEFRYWGSWLEPEAPAATSDIVLDYVRVSEEKPLLVFDTVSAFFSEGSENDATDVRRHMDGYRQLADLGATVLVLLHASEKGGNAAYYRGSTDFKASVDCGYRLKKLGKGQALERVQLECFKTRFPTQEKLTLQFDGASFSLDKSSAAVSEKLRAILMAHPGILQSEFEKQAKTAGVERIAARQYLDDRVKSGDVDLVIADKNAHCYSWKVSDKNETRSRRFKVRRGSRNGVGA